MKSVRGGAENLGRMIVVPMYDDSRYDRGVLKTL
jgi:hypothetical protein